MRWISLLQTAQFPVSSITRLPPSLLGALCAGKSAYVAIKKGNRIGYDLAKEQHIRDACIPFRERPEGETLGDFGSKFVEAIDAIVVTRRVEAFKWTQQI